MTQQVSGKPEDYDLIPGWPDGYQVLPRFFQHLPGVYCRGCKSTYALYSYSVRQPDGLDENKKPYYESCFKCKDKI